MTVVANGCPGCSHLWRDEEELTPSATRYQVLYDDGKVENFTTKRAAETRKRHLLIQGHKNVKVWDTQHNSLSSLLRLT